MGISLLDYWLPIIISCIALFFSIWTWRYNYISKRYETADNFLLEIHKIELNHPEFHDPDLIRQALNHSDPKVRYSYDIFACIIWNFLETLYDRYGERNLRKSPFFGAMKDLSKRHSAWFFKEENFSSFNPQLVKFLHVERYEGKGL